MRSLLFLISLMVLGASASESYLCPKYCKCTERTNGDGVARCSFLDKEVQRFTPSINHLIIENGKLPKSFEGNFVLHDRIFMDLKLKGLKSIKIVNSSLSEVRPKAFEDLVSLDEVDLSYNRLSKLDPDTFQSNVFLKKLRLKGNRLQMSENSTFLRSSTLSDLDLSECGINRLTEPMFTGLGFLEVLTLDKNIITEIKPGSLRSLSHLTDISFDRNFISKIDPNAFDGLIQLYSLSLRSNPIRSLEGVNLPQLDRFDASECQIRLLTENSLKGLTQLKMLNLSHNSIVSVHKDAFRSLPSLAYLYLSHNKLRDLPEFLFENNKKLEVISLAGNGELHALKGFANSFDYLYMYDLSDCGLGEISENTFSGMHYLATLNLSGNSLQEFQPGTFSVVRRLKKLDLSRNKLINLPSKVFSENKELERLYLSGNLMHHIPAHVLVPTEHLSLLDVSDNRLTFLWNSTKLKEAEMHPLGRLVYLNVANNRLRHLKESDFVDLKRLGRLDLTGNPLECSGDFARLVEWLIRQRVTPDKEPGMFPVEMREFDEIKSDAVSWDEFTKKVCPTPEVTEHSEPKPELKSELKIEPKPEPEPTSDEEGDNEDENEDDDNEEDGDEEEEETVKDNGPTKIKEELQIIGIDDKISLWPILLVGVVTMCVLFIVFNIVGLCVARRRYNLVSYKSQFPSPLGGMSQVRRGDSTHIYHKLYEDCSVPNTPIVKNGRGKCLISYLSGTAPKNPIQNV